MKKIFFLISICFLSSCASLSDDLSDSAKEIVIVDKIDEQSDLLFLKNLICRSGVYSKTPAINIERCKRDLRDKAAAIGATHLELTIRSISTQTNIVVMSAKAYKKK